MRKKQCPKCKRRIYERKTGKFTCFIHGKFVLINGRLKREVKKNEESLMS